MKWNPFTVLILGILLGCVTAANGASFSSVGSGSWHDLATWGGAGIPSIGDAVTINPGHNVVANATGICTNLTVLAGGTLSGSGNVELRLSAGSASVVNDGAISVATFRMPTATGTYSLGGAGSWTSNLLIVDFAAVARLTTNVNFAPATMVVATSSTFSLNGFGFTFSGANFTNNGTVNLGASTFAFNGTNNFTHTVGSFTGAGSLIFAPGDGSATIASDAVIAPSIQIASGILSGCFLSTVSGALTIAAGATLHCDGGTMTVNGNLTVDGSLSRSGPGFGVNLNFNGSTLTNNGSISTGFLVFNTSGGALAQSIAGAGSWASGTSFAIGQGSNLSPSTTTLANNVTISFDQFLIQQGSTLALNSNTFTYGGNDFRIFGTLAVGNATFEFTGRDRLATQTNGIVTGTGNVTLAPSDGAAILQGRFQTNVRILSGTITQNDVTTLNIGGDLTIDAGATLTSNNFVINTFANVLINGSLTGNPTGSLVVAGTNFTNNGTISNISVIFSPGACCAPLAPNVAQTLGGGGVWTGNGGITIAANSQITLLSNITFGGASFILNGSVATGAFVLTLPGSVAYSGTGEVAGSLRRNGFTVGATVAFGHPNTTIRFDSGTPPTELTVTLQNGLPPLFPNAVARHYIITPVGGSGYSATVRLHYLDAEINGNNEANLRLWRRDGANWTTSGTSVRDTTNNWVETSGVTQFSPWAIAELTPTAANVPITGRVLATDGRPVGGALIRLIDDAGNIRISMTNPFGFFRFDDVRTGRTYTMTATAKGRSFIPHTLTVTDEITGLELIAED